MENKIEIIENVVLDDNIYDIFKNVSFEFIDCQKENLVSTEEYDNNIIFVEHIETGKLHITYSIFLTDFQINLDNKEEDPVVLQIENITETQSSVESNEVHGIFHLINKFASILLTFLFSGIVEEDSDGLAVSSAASENQLNQCEKSIKLHHIFLQYFIYYSQNKKKNQTVGQMESFHSKTKISGR